MNTSALGQPYDFGSVMHYGWTDFAKDENVWTILPKKQFMNYNSTMGQRRGLSPIDIKKINILYECNSGKYRRSAMKSQ